MKKQWEQECADLRAELAAVQKKLHALETKQDGTHEGERTLSRWRVSKSMRLLVLPVVALLAAGGVLYGAGAIDALFIDPNGNVGIGTTAPHATLDVEGVIKAKTAIQGPMLGALKITETEKIVNIENNRDYVETMTPESDGFVVGLLNIANTNGDARCWIAGLIPDEKERVIEARSWLEVKPEGQLEMKTSFTMPVKKADNLTVSYGCIKGKEPVKSIQATIYWIPLGG